MSLSMMYVSVPFSSAEGWSHAYRILAITRFFGPEYMSTCSYEEKDRIILCTLKKIVNVAAPADVAGADLKGLTSQRSRLNQM